FSAHNRDGLRRGGSEMYQGVLEGRRLHMIRVAAESGAPPRSVRRILAGGAAPAQVRRRAGSRSPPPRGRRQAAAARSRGSAATPGSGARPRGAESGARRAAPGRSRGFAWSGRPCRSLRKDTGRINAGLRTYYQQLRHASHKEEDMTEKEQFLGALQKELPTTLKVLKAYPAAKADLKPHVKC